MGQTEILAVVWTHLHIQVPRSTWQEMRLHGSTEIQTGANDFFPSLTREEQLPLTGPVLIQARPDHTSLAASGSSTGELQSL